MITGAVTRSQQNSQDVVTLTEVDDKGTRRVLLRAYASPDGRKIRLYLPELKNFAQPWLRVEQALIDFERDPAAAQRSVRQDKTRQVPYGR